MDMLKYERELWQKGYKVVCGLDEVGIGAVAGPVVACAVVLDRDKAKFMLASKHVIKDSKQLTKRAREKFFDWIINYSDAIGVGIVDLEEINHIKNISKCGALARHRAVINLAKSGKGHCHIFWCPRDQNAEYALKVGVSYETVVPHAVLVDGPFDMPLLIKWSNVNALVGGDAKSASIASASVLAKVIRDSIMFSHDKIYPNYGWASNNGYLTKYHKAALKKYGMSAFHRKYSCEKFL
jgi:ribonuclease HII